MDTNCVLATGRKKDLNSTTFSKSIWSVNMSGAKII